MFRDVASAEEQPLVSRVMKLGRRRFSAIQEAVEASPELASGFSGELEEFLDWVECDCFPFQWRIDLALDATRYLARAPQAFLLFDKLEEFSRDPDKLPSVLELLSKLVYLDSNEMRWAYKDGVVKEMLVRAYASMNSRCRNLGERIQEKLLMEGFFDYLDIDPGS